VIWRSPHLSDVDRLCMTLAPQPLRQSLVITQPAQTCRAILLSECSAGTDGHAEWLRQQRSRFRELQRRLP